MSLRTFAAVLILSLAFLVGPHGLNSTQRVFTPTFEEKLLSARLACEARVVEKPDIVKVPLQEWNPWMPDSAAHDRAFTMQPFVLEITRVYVGNAAAGDTIEVLADFPYAQEMLDLNDSALFLLRWNSQFKAGHYTVDVEGLCPRVNGKYKAIDGSLFPAEFAREAAAKVSLPGLAHEAELIVVGQAVARRHEQLEVRSRALKVEIMTLGVEEVLKGTASERIEVLLFHPLRQARYFPEYRMAKPRNVGGGTRWLMFLAKGPHGWYPIRGHHGMLLIDETGALLRGGVSVGAKLEDAVGVIAGEGSR